MAETTPPSDDLKLRVLVERREGQTRLQYVLSSNSFTDWTLPGPSFVGSAEEFSVDLLRRMEDLGAGRGVGGELLLRVDIDRKLANLGRELYQTLFPPDMRRAYRLFRKSVRTLSIVSDEPWIPWEMLKAYDDSELDVIDDDFLCVQFQVTRWLSGDTAAPAEIAIDRLACITVPSNLPSATAERNKVRSLVRAHPEVQDVSPEVSTWDAIVKMLERGGLGLLHFVGHGDFDRARPNQSAIPLADGRSLLPEDLQGTARTQLRRDRPFVFLNACRVGQQSWALTGLGGWARRWIQDCGCSGFIGAHWAVKDSAALEFASAFYDAIERGETFGQASRTARLAVRAKRPDDPAWLAYAVYANARGSFRFPYTPLKRKPFEEFAQNTGAEGPSHGAQPPQPAPAPEVKGPASFGNLRIKQRFTDLDKDRFVEESFEYIANFFERSLDGLQRQYPNIEARFRRVDRNRFTASIYREGSKESSCRIWLGGRLGNISYAEGDSGPDNTYNEALSVEDDGYALFLRPFGLQIFNASNRSRLSQQEAAEHLWSMLIQRLQ